jgi:hypothetical protein
MEPMPGAQGAAYTNPVEYMQEARRLLGLRGDGIPNKEGLRLIDNFRKGGPRKFQGYIPPFWLRK